MTLDPPPDPTPPAGARIVKLSAFKPTSSTDWTKAINAATAACQKPGVTDAVLQFDAMTYPLSGKVGVPRIKGAPRVWWIGASRDSTIIHSTGSGDMCSTQADDTQFLGIEFDSTANTGGHAWSSSGNRNGLWHCAIHGGSLSNFAGRMTNGFTPAGVDIHSETPRKIVGYTDGQTIVDLIISGPTAGSNALMDFDFNSNLRLYSIQATGNRFDFYCVSGVFANSTFTPIAPGDPGWEVTTGFPPPGPFTIDNWISTGGSGRLLNAPPVGSKGYIPGRMSKQVTLNNLNAPSGQLTLGDCTGLVVSNSKLGAIHVGTTFHLDGAFTATTHGKVTYGQAAGASVQLTGA